MDGSRLTNFVERLTHLPLVWMLLWCGLFSLSVALLLLTRTPWGQYKPLRKCAFLSFLAHAILAGFATTVQIFSGFTLPVDTAAMAVAVLTTEDSGKKSETDSVAAQPWEAISESSVVSSEKVATTRSVSEDSSANHGDVHDLTERHPLSAFGAMVETAEIPQGQGGTFEPLSAHPLARIAPATPLEEPVPSRQSPAGKPMFWQSLQRGNRLPQNKPLAERLATIVPNGLRSGQAPVGLSIGGFGEALPGEGGRPEDPSAISVSAVPAVTLPVKENNPPQADEAQTQLAQDRSPESSATAAVPSQASPSEAISQEHQTPGLYQNRLAQNRDHLLQEYGGSRDTELAVETALSWLASNQRSDGRWDADQHEAGVERIVLGHDRQGAGLHADTGVSGLALLAFLGAGHTHQQGEYQETVQRGLTYLVSVQAADGNLAGEARLYARMYCHAIAALALSEALAMSGDPQLRDAVVRAVEYSIAAQHPVTGGWRYRPGDLGDTSQFGWQVMVLCSARLAGVTWPQETGGRVERFLRSVSVGSYGGLASYRPYSAASRTMTAEALVCRQLLEIPRQRAADQEAVQYLEGELPGEGRPNLYYWYYGTLSMFQYQGPSWRRWNEALKATLLASQYHHGALKGSWNAETVWGGYGGRVYTTALAALCLEVYYRYLPLYKEVARRRTTSGK